MVPAPQVRLVLAVSLDGRLAPPEGGAAQLGGRGDRRVLEEALAWADGALLGARTLRLHGSTCLIHQPDLLEQRRTAGLAEQPVAVVVSRSGSLPAQLGFWKQPLQRWLVAPQEVAASGFSRHLPLAPWPALLQSLAAAGLMRLVLLGGARLASQLLTLDLVDELQLTLCPRLLGGPHLWLPPPPPGAAVDPSLPQRPWQLLDCRPLGEGECLLHYGRPGAAASLPPSPPPRRG